MSCTTTKSRYYFGYGSNLWREQMARRCPKSKYQTRAFLKDWKFMIFIDGYATVAPCTEEDKKNGNDKVWGSIYILDSEDEKTLDKNEGVDKGFYTKEMKVCVFCPSDWESD